MFTLLYFNNTSTHSSNSETFFKEIFRELIVSRLKKIWLTSFFKWYLSISDLCVNDKSETKILYMQIAKKRNIARLHFKNKTVCRERVKNITLETQESAFRNCFETIPKSIHRKILISTCQYHSSIYNTIVYCY